MRENRSQVEFTTNSNTFSNCLSHYRIDQYVGSRKRLFHYVSCVQDRKRPFPILLTGQEKKWTRFREKTFFSQYDKKKK